ncbi:hypothetical protein, partial [Pseudomonas aeruginosa]|uniref:hypothetical protein n=3 Tax=Pseudomonas aeruginosa TaxID=287 RepID=UPI001EE76C95
DGLTTTLTTLASELQYALARKLARIDRVDMKSPPDKAGFSVSAVRISHPQRTATLILIDIGKKAGFALPPVISVLAAAFPFVLACSCQTPRSLVNWCTAIRGFVSGPGLP